MSRVMRYDVDPRKRSYRPEIISLHYDRLHNPDNCYHIRIDWMNVTAKLIEDAIVTWATSVEKYGLKLVEVPIAVETAREGAETKFTEEGVTASAKVIRRASLHSTRKPTSLHITSSCFEGSTLCWTWKLQVLFHPTLKLRIPGARLITSIHSSSTRAEACLPRYLTTETSFC